ncbi:hypothetical protein EDB89DRAFT_1909973 [Lactarius sanguifluus]|nr:hypothetical protein EDB89DRAFT_1909973 [Lactarius sanguifluus]
MPRGRRRSGNRRLLRFVRSSARSSARLVHFRVILDRGLSDKPDEIVMHSITQQDFARPPPSPQFAPKLGQNHWSFLARWVHSPSRTVSFCRTPYPKRLKHTTSADHTVTQSLGRRYKAPEAGAKLDFGILCWRHPMGHGARYPRVTRSPRAGFPVDGSVSGRHVNQNYFFDRDHEFQIQPVKDPVHPPGFAIPRGVGGVGMEKKIQ